MGKKPPPLPPAHRIVPRSPPAHHDPPACLTETLRALQDIENPTVPHFAQDGVVRTIARCCERLHSASPALFGRWKGSVRNQLLIECLYFLMSESLSLLQLGSAYLKTTSTTDQTMANLPYKLQRHLETASEDLLHICTLLFLFHHDTLEATSNEDVVRAMGGAPPPIRGLPITHLPSRNLWTRSFDGQVAVEWTAFRSALLAEVPQCLLGEVWAVDLLAPHLDPCTSGSVHMIMFNRLTRDGGVTGALFNLARSHFCADSTVPSHRGTRLGIKGIDVNAIALHTIAKGHYFTPLHLWLASAGVVVAVEPWPVRSLAVIVQLAPGFDSTVLGSGFRSQEKDLLAAALKGAILPETVWPLDEDAGKEVREEAWPWITQSEEWVTLLEYAREKEAEAVDDHLIQSSVLGLRQVLTTRLDQDASAIHSFKKQLQANTRLYEERMRVHERTISRLRAKLEASHSGDIAEIDHFVAKLLQSKADAQRSSSEPSPAAATDTEVAGRDGTPNSKPEEEGFLASLWSSIRL